MFKPYSKMNTQRQTAGETAKPTSPIILVIFRDCHARHNLVVTANNEREERTYRRMATKQGYLVAVRKPKNPTCDNCDHMTIRNFKDGTAHRHCDLMGLYVPDNEQSPTCDLHTAISKFERMMAAKAIKEGGAQ